MLALSLFLPFDYQAAFRTRKDLLQDACQSISWPTSQAPCSINRCPDTLIPSLREACSLGQLWEADQEADLERSSMAAIIEST